MIFNIGLKIVCFFFIKFNRFFFLLRVMFHFIVVVFKFESYVDEWLICVGGHRGVAYMLSGRDCAYTLVLADVVNQE